MIVDTTKRLRGLTRVVLLGFALGCPLLRDALCEGKAESKPTSVLPPGAKLVFQDDFQRQELGAYPQGNVDEKVRARLNWCVRRGKWEIRSGPDGNGYLFGEGGPAEVVLTTELASNIRLEYLTWSPNPGDRSAFVCVPLPNFAYEDIYSFHFAGGYSKYNVLTRLGRPITDPVASPLPKPGQKCQVVIQQADGLLEMFVDDRVVFSVKDTDYPQVRPKLTGPLGTNVGLYTWSDGVCFDDLKVFSLLERKRLSFPREAKATLSFWNGFQEDTIGAVPKQASVQAGLSCSALVVNEPTVVYRPRPEGQMLVQDLCVELRDASPRPGEVASVTIPFPAVRSGEAEVELLVWSHEGDSASISLLGSGGEALASLVVDKEGTLFARTPTGTEKLASRVSYANRPPDGRFYLQAKRWFTLRFSFDAEVGLYNASVVNLYAGFATPGISHFTLGADLPFLATGAVCGLKVATASKARLLVDNICMASPAAATLNGKPCTTLLREILGLSFPWRTDPVSLSVHPLRNEANTLYPQEEMRNRYRRLATPRFQEAGCVYDRLMVRQAFLDERAHVLSRMLYHLAQTGADRRVPTQLKAALQKIADSKESLEQLLRLYGHAFYDSLNEQKLTDDFDPAARALEAKLAALEAQADALGRACVAAAGGKLEPAPPLAPGPYDAPLEWRDGRFQRGGKPTFFYAPIGCRSTDMTPRGNTQRLLGLDNCFLAPFILDQPDQSGRTDTDSFTWNVFDQFMKDYVLKDNPAVRIGVQSALGCVYLMQFCPAWWLERHRQDPDIFFQDRAGKNPNWEGEDQPYKGRGISGGPYAGGGGYRARLNFWNPEVLKMYRSMLEGWSQYLRDKYPGRLTYFTVGEEANQYAMTETGFNPSAVPAFQAFLKNTYRTVNELNETWGAAYGSFEEIDPRQYSSKQPNGLMYEFQRFRQAGYWNWMRLIKECLKKNLPELVILNDFHNAADWPAHGGLDAPSMFKVYDVVGNHYYGVPAWKPVSLHRMLDSLHKAYGTPLGNFEWAAGVRSGDLFNEDAHKADGLMEMFEQMAWGRSVLAVWYGGSAGFAEGAQYWSPTLGHSVLRYSTSYIPVGRMRSRRFGEIALKYPTVTPKLALLESSTSFLNGIDCRATRIHVADALDRKQWNYGFLFEDVLLEGKQSLKGIHTLVLPRCLCLKPEVSTKLRSWVRDGGTLVAVLPPGVFNQYGRPDGSLFRALMGQADITFNTDFSQATIARLDTRKVTTQATGERDRQLLTADCDKGRLCVYTSSSPFPEENLLRLVERYTPRDVHTVSGSFRIVVRESAKHLYVFAVNPDLYETRDDVIILAGRYRKAVDLGCDAAFPIKTTTVASTTRFKLRLAPGEGTVVRLAK